MALKIWPIFQIPVPASEEHITLYTRIRLRGLSTNPETFGSTYARESAFTREIWTTRLNTTGRTTLAAKLEDDEGHEDWVGTLSILAPEMLSGIPQEPAYPAEIAEAEKVGRADVYMLVGMWVHPDYRGKGIGRQLVERALETVKLIPPKFTSNLDRVEIKEKVVLLEVHAHNDTAKKLYERIGFVKQESGVEADSLDEDTEVWMAFSILE
ncbi:hypothetical protein GALMADRAFT_259590 [Galerina marginata CBS 339.88]|uniref:N-acetyltransferase domain-containing protein n=1 Tax=Galerina marginata (strain CBS 339.88) TaxID=685588 RepID=A0A067S674_GALM3|nr:hypothetical protein GALMADRAFT_259590 [Galerina marginata CBS 339.88]